MGRSASRPVWRGACKPPSPQKALTYTYTPDTSLKRWITTVGLAGVGDTTYREDSKGRVLETVNTFGQTTRTDHDLEGRVRTLLTKGGTIEVARPAVKFGYHYFVRYGNRVIDSMTGPGGQPYNQWVRRFNRGGQPFDKAFKLKDVTDLMEQPGTLPGLP